MFSLGNSVKFEIHFLVFLDRDAIRRFFHPIPHLERALSPPQPSCNNNPKPSCISSIPSSFLLKWGDSIFPRSACHLTTSECDRPLCDCKIKLLHTRESTSNVFAPNYKPVWKCYKCATTIGHLQHYLVLFCKV